MCHIDEFYKRLHREKCHNFISEMYRKCDEFDLLLLLYALVVLKEGVNAK